jgi:hypothetical protein
MKRYMTIVAVGLSLFVGGSVALLLFPHSAGARTVHSTTSNRLAGISRAQSLQASSALASTRTIESAIQAYATSRTAQQRQVGSRQHSTMRLLSYGAARQSHGTARATSRMPHADRFGTRYRTASRGRFTAMARSGATRTGHNCPGM